MRRTFAVSSIVHIAFLILVITPGFQGSRRRIVDVMSVRLVEAEKKQEPKAEIKKVDPPQPQPQQEKKTEQPKMAYKSKTKTRKTEQEVKQDQPKPKQPEPPRARAPEPEPEAEEREPQKPGPSSGSTSNVRVDDEDFRFAYYLEIIKERVSFNWSPPPVSGGPDVLCTVYFKIMRDGRISGIKVEQSSDFDLFDKSAVRAVDLSGPMPPLPAGFEARWLGVHFEFQQTSG